MQLLKATFLFLTFNAQTNKRKLTHYLITDTTFVTPSSKLPHSDLAESRLPEYSRLSEKGTLCFSVSNLSIVAPTKSPTRLVPSLPPNQTELRRRNRPVTGMQAFKNMATSAMGGGPSGPAGPQAGTDSVPSDQNNDSSAQVQQQQPQQQQQQSQNTNGNATQVLCRAWRGTLLSFGRSEICEI